MNTQPEALLYNFNDPERLRQIRRYLNRQKVKTRIVTAPEFLHPLGYLFEIPGFHPSSQFNLGNNFSDEMIVLKDFSSAQMDSFLAFFRENQLPPVALKAMLTPVTQHWSSIQLHDELSREHTLMHKNNCKTKICRICLLHFRQIFFILFFPRKKETAPRSLLF